MIAINSVRQYYRYCTADIACNCCESPTTPSKVVVVIGPAEYECDGGGGVYAEQESPPPLMPPADDWRTRRGRTSRYLFRGRIAQRQIGRKKKRF